MTSPTSTATARSNEDWERQAYGCLAKDLDAQVADSMYVRTLGPAQGLTMLITSILSDAQELLRSPQHSDRVRQHMNCAKYILNVHLAKIPEAGQDQAPRTGAPRPR